MLTKLLLGIAGNSILFRNSEIKRFALVILPSCYVYVLRVVYIYIYIYIYIMFVYFKYIFIVQEKKRIAINNAQKQWEIFHVGTPGSENR
jgi:hypothetical protein